MDIIKYLSQKLVDCGCFHQIIALHSEKKKNQFEKKKYSDENKYSSELWLNSPHVSFIHYCYQCSPLLVLR